VGCTQGNKDRRSLEREQTRVEERPAKDGGERNTVDLTFKYLEKKKNKQTKKLKIKNDEKGKHIKSIKERSSLGLGAERSSLLLPVSDNGDEALQMGFFYICTYHLIIIT